MLIQRNFVLNVGFGRSPTSIFEVEFEKSDSKIASWYQLAIFESDFSNSTSKILVGLLPNPTFSTKLR